MILLITHIFRLRILRLSIFCFNLAFPFFPLCISFSLSLSIFLIIRNLFSLLLFFFFFLILFSPCPLSLFYFHSRIIHSIKCIITYSSCFAAFFPIYGFSNNFTLTFKNHAFVISRLNFIRLSDCVKGSHTFQY